MKCSAMGPIKSGDNFLFVLILTLIWIRLAGGQIPKLGLKYCTETSPLDTKYFVPFYESHVPVVGCVARERSTTPSGYEVHVIRINTTSKEVMLHFNGQKKFSWDFFTTYLNTQRFNIAPNYGILLFPRFNSCSDVFFCV